MLSTKNSIGNFVTLTLLPYQQGMWLVPTIMKIVCGKYDVNRTKTNELLRHHCSCHGNVVTIATSYAANAYCPKEALY